MPKTDYLYAKNYFVMTINEKKQLSAYIKGLVRESINEMPLPNGFFQGAEDLPVIDDPKPGDEAELDADPEWEKESSFRHFPPGATVDADPIEDDGDDDEEDEDLLPDKESELWHEHDHPESRRSNYEGPDVTGTDDVDYKKMNDTDNIAGINELRRLTESMARNALKSFLTEKKGKKKNKDGNKKESKKEKGRKSSEKTLMDRLNSDSVNSAHYFYKLYGVENGSDDEKAAARSLGYKKSKGKKLPGKKGTYHFSSKERNKLNAMLTNDKN